VAVDILDEVRKFQVCSLLKHWYHSINLDVPQFTAKLT